MSAPISRRPMTPEERIAYYAMRLTVRFPSASWDKRFFRHLGKCGDAELTITDKEAPQLWRLLVRYRRQWMRSRNTEDTELLRLAESKAAPDYRKVQAAAREQSAIDALKAKYQAAMQPSKT